MSSTDTIKQKMVDLLTNSSFNYVIQLYGSWGIGKTYLWKDVISEIDKKKKKVVEISLFDKSSIDELKEDILLQTFAINNTLKKYSKTLDGIQNGITSILKYKFGVAPKLVKISSVLSILKKDDFSNIIISFDDVERRSPNLDFNSFLGFVSLLKDSKNCNVVLILNYDKLPKEDKTIFDEYKEKIVDYNMIINRSASESLNCAIGKSEVSFNDVLTEVVNELNINNIRIIKHMIKMINEIDGIDFTKYNSVIMKEFMKLYLYYSFIYFYSGISKIKNLLNYSMERSSFNYYKENNKPYDGDFKVNEKYEELLSFSYDFNIFYHFRNEVLYLLDEIMESHYISLENKAKLETELQHISDNKDLILASERITNEYFNCKWDISNDVSIYYDNIINDIKEYKTDIVRQMKIGGFINVIDLVSTYNPTEVKELENECIEYYMNWLVDLSPNYHYDLVDHWTNKGPLSYLEERGYIDDYNKLKEEKQPTIDLTLIDKAFNKINSYDGVYDQLDSDIINGVSIELLSAYLKSSPNAMRAIHTFIGKRGTFEEFANAKKTVLETLKNIYSEANTLANEKIDRIFSEKKYEKILKYIKNEEEEESKET